MKLLFKVSGFLLVVLVSSAIGFLKSNTLNLRYKKLCKIHSSIADLKERIRLHGGEIDRLINLSFESYPINYTALEKEDIILIEDFFKNIGMSDTKAEYERCELYMSLIDTKIGLAQKNYMELGKLYKNIGFLGGIFICIFFL